ncbi:SLC13 family permease [Novosphingobium taihuense]|uniref:Di/tricarboxylate transporter n=1 Tax=Novosphingobium taihuense TaxID=260085 RepID=A0A7W7EUC5_9SPHN|nr:SLC13 family permease [Novosphingobium taihuense]MBB4613909.1 di/tricarboxylate transporter [Novosphingobium taihuense]TWH86760.1 Na+/H+ antiporter NhaD/arsenite permease-like protein [Novosphingobium taihuense]
MILLSIAILVAIFAAAVWLPVNMGLIGLTAALALGVFGAGLPVKDILAGFPADLFLTLLGITYLFGIASRNGAIDWLVARAAALLGRHTALVPLLVFMVAGTLTGLGAMGPAAVAIVAPVAMRLARSHGFSPLMMGLLVVHGAQAGSFSPISIYGGITAKVLGQSGIAPDAQYLFLASAAFNAAIALLVWAFFIRREAVAGAGHESHLEPVELDRNGAWTLAGLATLAAGALLFKIDIGFMALLVILALAVVAPRTQDGALKQVDWSTILLISGIVIYVSLLDRIGTLDAVSAMIERVGSPMLAVLLLCYLAGVVSAFASSTALLGVIIPLSLPILAAGQLPVMPVVAAICIANTIVDTSPFSTNGALIVGNAPEDERPAMLRKLLGYAAIIVGIGPLLAWAAFVGLGSL